MKRTHRSIVCLFIVALTMMPSITFATVLAQAAEVNIDSVRVEVIVLPNGRINVTYWMEFTVKSGSLGGFDLSGIQESSIYDPARAYADYDGTHYPLVITPLANGYGLDWTPRTQEDESVLIVFGYFSTNRIIEKTTATVTLEGSGSTVTGDFGVFNWAPVQWEQEIGYESIRVVYPIIMDPSWITGEGGITPDGADYAGYVVDSRQAIEDSNGNSWEYDEENLLAYPSSASASPRNFSLSLRSNIVLAYDHLRVFHYTNWSF
ncbi:MAG: hypothetical protein ACFFDR_07995, partial [Candidatus Thorarchaeota archaeon]